MNSFWKNINKYPRFLISIIAGFFLTTFQPIFELLKDPKKGFLLTVFSGMIIAMITLILKLMLGLN